MPRTYLPDVTIKKLQEASADAARLLRHAQRVKAEAIADTDRWKELHKAKASDFRALRALYDQMALRVSMYEVALHPFAEAATRQDPEADPSRSIHDLGASHVITIGDLNRAWNLLHIGVLQDE